MNKLTTQNQTLAEKQFNSVLVSKVENIKEKKNLLIDLLGKLYYSCGQSISSAELNVLAQSFATSLEKYKWLTVKELEIVFEKGRKKGYGEYYGLNVNTFEIWIEAYDKKDRQIKMLANKVDAPIEEKKMTQNEIDAYMQPIIDEAILTYQKTGKIELAPSKYRYLDEKGELQKAFNKNDEDWHNYKRDIYKSMVRILTGVYEEKKAASREEKADIRNVLESLKKPKDGKAIVASKEYILEEYFKLKIK